MDNNNENFIYVKYKKTTTKPSTRIIGKSVDQNTGLKAKKPFLRKKVFFITNIEKGNSTSIVQHLNKQDIPVISCIPLVQKDVNDITHHNMSSYPAESYRLCVPRSDAYKVRNPNIWPASIVIKNWNFKRKAAIDNEKGSITIVEVNNNGNSGDDNNNSNNGDDDGNNNNDGNNNGANDNDHSSDGESNSNIATDTPTTNVNDDKSDECNKPTRSKDQPINIKQIKHGSINKDTTNATNTTK